MSDWVYNVYYVQCLQTSDAIAYLHSVKPPVLHRDLRSANILMDNAGQVKVRTESCRVELCLSA